MGVVLVLVLLQSPSEFRRRLSDEDIAVRSSASDELKRLGPLALPVLECLDDGSDLELAQRVGALLRWIRADELVPAAIKAQMPDLVDRLAANGPHEWTAAFLELRRTLRPNAAAVLAPLCVPALRGAATDAERGELLGWIRTCWHEPAADELGCWLVTNDARLRRLIADTLFHLQGRKAIPQLLPLLLDADDDVQLAVAMLLRSLAAGTEVKAFVRAVAAKGGPKEKVPAIATNGRLTATPPDLSCREPCPPEFRDEIVKLLGDGLEEVVQDLLIVFGPRVLLGLYLFGRDRLPAEALSRNVRPLLTSVKADVRRTALSAVNIFGLSDLVGEVRLALRDADPRVVVSACRALGSLCAKEALAELRQLLRHDSPDVRLAAIESIAGFEAFDLQDDLARALGRLEDESIPEPCAMEFNRTELTPLRRRIAAAEESIIEMMRRRNR